MCINVFKLNNNKKVNLIDTVLMSESLNHSLKFIQRRSESLYESPLYVSQSLNSSDVVSIRTIFVVKIETDDITFLIYRTVV